MKVAAGVIFSPQRDQVLLARRPPNVHLGDLWEFPGGKLEPQETVEDALRRELAEEIGIEVVRSRPLIRLVNRYPDRTVTLNVHEVLAYRGTPHGREGQRVIWASPADLHHYPFPAANQPIIKAIRLPDRLAILPVRGDPTATILNAFEGLKARGISLVRLREEGAPVADARLITWVAAAADLGLTVLIGGSPERVVRVGAQGLHLRSDEIAQYRQRPLPRGVWVSAACHTAAELKAAQGLDIDFVVLGPVLPTPTHPGAKTLGWPGFCSLIEGLNLPVYALGGLDETHLSEARDFGAQGIAAIRAFAPV